MKACSRCRVEKLLSEFHRAKGRPQGVHPQCKDCRSSLGREQRTLASNSRTAARLLLADGLKKCSACDEIKSLDDFYANKRNKASGRHGYCKPCYTAYGTSYRATPEAKSAAKAALASRRAADPEAFRRRSRAATFRHKYGIGLDEYEAMLSEQQGRCAICFRLPLPDEPPLYVDHSHETGEVRGLLCQLCNSGLGMFADDTAVLQSAIRYLEERNGQRNFQTWTALHVQPN